MKAENRPSKHCQSYKKDKYIHEIKTHWCPGHHIQLCAWGTAQPRVLYSLTQTMTGEVGNYWLVLDIGYRAIAGYKYEDNTSAPSKTLPA